jgi:hypothetical protein
LIRPRTDSASGCQTDRRGARMDCPSSLSTQWTSAFSRSRFCSSVSGSGSTGSTDSIASSASGGLGFRARDGVRLICIRGSPGTRGRRFEAIRTSSKKVPIRGRACSPIRRSIGAFQICDLTAYPPPGPPGAPTWAFGARQAPARTLAAVLARVKRLIRQPWFDRALAAVALSVLVIAAVRIQPKDWFARGLLLIVAAVLVKAVWEGRQRRPPGPPPPPQLSLDATTGGSNTSQDESGRMADLYVTLFIRNAEDAGEANHVKVLISTVAAKCFHVHPKNQPFATDNLIADEQRIVWQPGTIGPGGEAELRLKTDWFHFDNDEVVGAVRITADRGDPWACHLTASVHRYHQDSGAAEFEAAITKDGAWVAGTHGPTIDQ